MRGIKDLKKNNRFSDLIKEKGYSSVAEFATDCNTTPQQIFKYIRGEYAPSVKNMLLYARVLDVDIKYIIDIFYPGELAN